MAQVDRRLRRGIAAILGAALLTGCGSGPATPTPPPATPAPSSAAPVLRPGPPASLDRVADGPTLHGDAVTGPRLVAVPGGTFLMLKSEDMPTGGVLLRSGDGRTWAQVDASRTGLDAGAIADMAASDTTVVILGTTEPMSGDSTQVLTQGEWTSTDGTTWTRVPDAAALQAFGALNLVGSPAGFVLLGSEPLGILMSGPDGRQWRHMTLPVPAGANGSLNQVVPTTDGYLAVGTINGRSAAWRWNHAGWSGLPFVNTDSITSIVANDERILVAGSVEVPDPVNPNDPRLTSVAWQSTDGGATWGATGLALDGIGDIRLFAVGGGFLAVLSPTVVERQLSAWRSVSAGTWEPVTLANGGTGWDRPLAGVMALSGRRVVLAGNTVGTGAGGDRVVIWYGDTTAP